MGRGGREVKKWGGGWLQVGKRGLAEFLIFSSPSPSTLLKLRFIHLGADRGPLSLAEAKHAIYKL
jgi:hypothetical protein